MPEFAKHSALCAQRYSGADVVLLTDHDVPGWQDVFPYTKGVENSFRDIAFHNNGIIPREAYFLFRWFIVYEYVIRNHVASPIMSLDWDILVFEDLWLYFSSLGIAGFDFGSVFSRDRTKDYSVPTVIVNLSVLEAYATLISLVFKLWPKILMTPSGKFAGGGDMIWWNRLATLFGYDVLTISNEFNGKLFDANIVLDTDLYEHDGCIGKKVVIENGKPHFVRKDGTLVKAVAVHCFMEWKKKTGELIGNS